MAAQANVTYVKLQDIYKSPSIFPTLQNFSMSQVLNYFIEAVSADSKLKQDFKSLRESSFQMFKAGHVQDICLKAGFRTLIIISSCLPEMRKDKIYSLMIRIEVPTADIQFAKCECAAGMGPKATCKHIASLCYALEDFVRIFMFDVNSNSLACTDQLMQWNQPRGRKLSPKKLSLIDFSVEKIRERKRKSNLKGETKDDMLGEISQGDIDAVRDLKRDLTDYQKKKKLQISLLTVLGHEPITSRKIVNSVAHSQDSDRKSDSLTLTKIRFKEGLQVSSEIRNKIFHETKEQSKSAQWYQARKGRISGSVCGKILNRNETIFPKSILSSILHEKKVETAAMRMGKEKEREILIRYKQFIHETRRKDVELQCCGFLISLEKGWLGASPDAVIIESNQLQGCV